MPQCNVCEYENLDAKAETLQVPVLKQKKVPRTKCEEVPGIDCFFVLKRVADLGKMARGKDEKKD